MSLSGSQRKKIKKKMKITSFLKTAVGKYLSFDNKYDKEESPFRFRNRSFIGKQIM